MRIRYIGTAVCLWAGLTGITCGAIVTHRMEFHLRGSQAATIVGGNIGDPGRNTLTFGASGLPIESVVLSGSFMVDVRIDEATDMPISLRFPSSAPASIIADRPVNYFVPDVGMLDSGYVHVGAQIEPIPNAPADGPEFVATGRPAGNLLTRTTSFTPISTNGVFDADRQSLMVTSGEYIASGLVGNAFVIPVDQLIDASLRRLIITSQSHDPNGDKGLINVHRSATGYAGNIQLDLSETFGHLRISARTIPEPGGAIALAALGLLMTCRRPRRRAVRR